jgi:hypothetical protein
MRAYYAHCKGIYGTPQETRDIAILESLGFDVLNPSDSQYDDSWREHGMDFKDVLLAQCGCIAFRALPDGAIPAGVYTELAKAIRDYGIPAIELPSSILRRGIDVEQTREYLREIGER